MNAPRPGTPLDAIGRHKVANVEVVEREVAAGRWGTLHRQLSARDSSTDRDRTR